MNFLNDLAGEGYSLGPWRCGDKARILDVANICMKVIENAGLSLREASEVPKCLENTIKRSNYISEGKTSFKAAKVKFVIFAGGYEAIDPDATDD